MRAGSVRDRLETLASGRALVRAFTGLVEIEMVDRSMTLAAQLFTSVLPVIIASAVLTDRDIVTRTLETQFGYAPAALVRYGGHPPVDPSFAAFGVAGLLMLAISGTSFARALARIYGRIWAVPAIGLRRSWRWFAVLFLVALSAVSTAALHAASAGAPAGVAVALFTESVVWLFVWTACPALLTVGAVPSRVLWASGACTAVGLTAVRLGGYVVLPRATATAEAQFGALGLVFTTIGWLFVVSVVVVAAPVLVQTLRTGEGRIGRFLGG
ncbi:MULTISPECIES: hypothetical protein [Rhodococcus]|jgi:membrane protein|uniref:hypothetical protein n=1 Tax=Rhodococcus TaxID=1827 RepID=UPI000622D0A5|nr:MULTISPECIES: hypothetical protein [Rhodococcus]AKE88018.1 hypothetical protein AAT18_00900 [Rhodococcus aetherivorans]MBC2590454.1 hypothetical protein [Rhodococcus aetherivorans]QRI76638.1 hypothetical protein JQ505_02220 [Rhodococcus aetherivorans]QSE60055.1 hypothetical protein JYA75_03335 [Rhodococcus sp. PSBB066]QSE68639.1 hypothetical protein JYA91_24260 [Rhodococcus sp. PSBB049]